MALILRQYLKKNRAYKALVRQNVELAKIDLQKQAVDPAVQNINELSPCAEKMTAADTEENDLVESLLKYFREEKPYLHSKLSMDDLSKALNTNRSYLSKAINDCLNKNFYELLNEYRIKEARLLLIDHTYDHISIEGIGQMVGFASRSSFYNCFNKSYGISPSYFRNSIKHDLTPHHSATIETN